MTPYDDSDTKALKAGTQGKAHGDAGPTRSEAEAAVEVLLRWAGDDPTREGLIGTPGRVARAWKEFCVGYTEDPASLLSSTFEEVEGYDDMVMLRNIGWKACEHHMVPPGVAYAYA